MRLFKRVLTSLGVIALSAYLGVLGWLYVEQRSILFRADPTRYHAANLPLPGFRDVEIVTADKERLVGLYKPPEPGHPVILYFHGNAGRVPPRVGRITTLSAHGSGVLFLSYRGYSGSTGSPSEEGLAEDARSSFDWLRGQVGSAKIILYGESLGTGVAVRLATERKVAGVVLDAPYTSTVDVALRTYWWVPVSLLMRDQFRSLDRIAKIGVPLLVLHGDADAVVPFELGQRVYAAGLAPKRFVRNPGGSHSRNLETASADVLAFIDEVGRAPPSD